MIRYGYPNDDYGRWKPNGYDSQFSYFKEPSASDVRVFKVVVIGSPTVGKTSFVRRYIDEKFSQNYRATIGVDFGHKVIEWDNEKIIKLQLWDIAGQDRVGWMSRVYYKNAHGAIIMFDLTNRESFMKIHKWKSDLDTDLAIPCMLLANKCDLPDRQVDQMEIEHLNKELNFDGWTETSVKEGFMVNDSIRFLVEAMLKKDSLHQSHMNSTFSLTDRIKRKSSCKCPS